MKKAMVLGLILFLCLCSAAWAEGGVNVEVIKMDGISVVVLTPPETMLRARSLASSAEGADEKQDNFILPQFLTLIEESAFKGIAAEKVEVSASVVAIEARAFADCRSLQEITIPATVLKIDDHAFDGCESMTVYGTKGTEAERIATLYGFRFVDPNADPETPVHPVVTEAPPVVLPFVPAD